MNTAEVIATLDAHAGTPRTRGVERLGLYGSAALQEELEQLFGRSVDLTTTPIANPVLAREINRDLTGVF